ncbi:MAG: glycosidase [Planctomycetota bacterium]
MAYRAPVQLARSDANPILSPNPDNDWEALVTTNPGAIYDEEQGKFVLLYRAAGEDQEHRIYLGLATSDDGVNFERASNEPALSPSVDGAHDMGGIEDPRVMQVGDWYYVTYASRAYHAGQYWLMAGNPSKPPECPDEFPIKFRENLTTTSLAITKDFRDWRRCGPVTDPRYDDRDVYFLPERVGGRWWMIHRPMEWVGKHYGTEHPAMWINSSEDLLHWDSSTSRLLAKAEFPWEVKVGGNTPPLRTEHGWLTIYHAKGPDGYYRLGVMLLDLDNPAQITHRTRGWIIQPEQDYETQGCYDMGGVIFPCGAVVRDGILHVYYGGADKYVGLATVSMKELLDYTLECPV